MCHRGVDGSQDATGARAWARGDRLVRHAPLACSWPSGGKPRGMLAGDGVGATSRYAL